MPSASKTIAYRTLSADFTSAIFDLYLIADWVDIADSKDFIAPMLKGSLATLGAFNSDGTLIGMGRAISDGASDAYIQDIVVTPQYRKQGIGGEIVQRIAQKLVDSGIDWIGLIGEPGTMSFYEKLGFKVLDNHIPMRYKPCK